MQISVCKTRFFGLLKEYRQDPETFSLSYKRATRARLLPAVEAEVEGELLQEKEIVEDPTLAHLGLQLFRRAGPLAQEGDPSLPEHHHPSGQTFGLLQTSQEKGSLMTGKWSPLPSAPCSNTTPPPTSGLLSPKGNGL